MQAFLCGGSACVSLTPLIAPYPACWLFRQVTSRDGDWLLGTAVFSPLRIGAGAHAADDLAGTQKGPGLHSRTPCNDAGTQFVRGVTEQVMLPPDPRIAGSVGSGLAQERPHPVPLAIRGRAPTVCLLQAFRFSPRAGTPGVSALEALNSRRGSTYDRQPFLRFQRGEGPDVSPPDISGTHVVGTRSRFDSNMRDPPLGEGQRRPAQRGPARGQRPRAGGRYRADSCEICSCRLAFSGQPWKPGTGQAAALCGFKVRGMDRH